MNWARPLKRVDTDRPIVFEQELDRRTFETLSVHYVINENIFRIFVTIFFINFFFSCSTSLWLHFDFILTSPAEGKVKSKWSQSEVKMESRFPKISRKFFRFPNKHQLSIIHTVSRRSCKYGTRSVSLSTSSRAQKLEWYSFWTSFWQPLVRNGRPWLQIGLGGVEKMFGWRKKNYKVLAIAPSDIIFNF